MHTTTITTIPIREKASHRPEARAGSSYDTRDEPDALPTASHADESYSDAEEAREAALRAELEGVQNINTVIEGVIGSLEKAKQNMEACKSSFHTPRKQWPGLPCAELTRQFGGQGGIR